jgi:hypothetical protein
LSQALGPYAENVLSESIKVLDDVESLSDRLDYNNDFKFSVGFEVMEKVRWKEPYSNLKVCKPGKTLPNCRQNPPTIYTVTSFECPITYTAV